MSVLKNVKVLVKHLRFKTWAGGHWLVWPDWPNVVMLKSQHSVLPMSHHQRLCVEAGAQTWLLGHWVRPLIGHSASIPDSDWLATTR